MLLLKGIGISFLNHDNTRCSNPAWDRLDLDVHFITISEGVRKPGIEIHPELVLLDRPGFWIVIRRTSSRLPDRIYWDVPSPLFPCTCEGQLVIHIPQE